MKKYGLKVILKAKPGKEKEVKKFISSAVDLAQEEEQTITWYAFQQDDFTFGIFDTFNTKEGREAHLNGDIAKALKAHASDLLSENPVIEKINILASK